MHKNWNNYRSFEALAESYGRLTDEQKADLKNEADAEGARAFETNHNARRQAERRLQHRLQLADLEMQESERDAGRVPEVQADAELTLACVDLNRIGDAVSVARRQAAVDSMLAKRTAEGDATALRKYREQSQEQATANVVPYLPFPPEQFVGGVMG